MLAFKARPYTLKFRFEAGTSRGVLTEKHGWFIRLTDPDDPARTGLGECSLIPGLSPDPVQELSELIAQLSAHGLDVDQFTSLHAARFPALAFAVETALASLEKQGSMCLFPSAFTEGQKGIPINGLIWMGDIATMKARINEKIAGGFTTIKLKVGALNFEDELALIAEIRKHYGPEQITLRLDANGAFRADEALEKLKRLSDYHIHSIEQPIKAGQIELMAELCRQSPVPIALDEELTGQPDEEMFNLLDAIRPHYIILKPSLLGGLRKSALWIAAAERLGIGWWVTSALESNLGLNAIAQWTATLHNNMPQGLGTGQLYHNNIPSPLYIRDASLWYDSGLGWKLPEL
ncbi:MAG: o-succinylbenzoate synthase [Bacteroidetes bacterium]|nr:o-succinylbenzoate synthase [Bacteroidota bacterium]